MRGRSLLDAERNDAVFAEITFHAAYEPQRAVRTKRYKYIRRFDNGHAGPVLPNIDDSPSKDYLLARGLADRVLAAEELYDLVFDPNEANNLVGRPGARSRSWPSCAGACWSWMQDTDDPLLHGPVEPEPGVELNLPGPGLAGRADGGRAVTGLVLQTQTDAPAGLLEDWAARRGFALETFRVDGDAAWPDPRALDFVVALGSSASAAGGGPPWVDRVIEFLRAADAADVPDARHLLRRAGPGRRAGRLRAQARPGPRSAG